MDTAELSVYVKSEFRNRGIGKKLLAKGLAAGKKCGLHTVVSQIVEGNGASIHLHEEAGFRTVGVLHEVGYKFEKLLDVRIMQLIFVKAPKA